MNRGSVIYVVLVIVGCIYLAIAINVAKIHWDGEQLRQEYEKQPAPMGVPE